MGDFYAAPHSRAHGHSTGRISSIPGNRSSSASSSRRPVVVHSSVQRHIAIDAPPRMRYAGYFNERRSAAPKFSTSSRFGPERRHDDDDGYTPGPAAYNTARSTLRRDTGVSFSTATRERVSKQVDEEEAPGPGAYNTAQSTLRRSTGAKFSTAPRENISRQLDQEEAPGPGAYNTVVSSFAKAAVKKRASSVSGSHRHNASAAGRSYGSGGGVSAAHSHADPMAMGGDDDVTPGPGAYRVQLAKNAVARHTPAASMGRAARFDDGTFYGKRIDPDEPSSLTYASRVNQRPAVLRKPSSRMGTISTAPRFANERSRRNDDGDFGPGPGAYSPLYGLL